MDNKEKSIFKGIFESIEGQYLGRAIKQLRRVVEAHPYLMFDDELDNVERDYKLMLDYFGQGFNDPQRFDLYQNLLSRLYKFTLNLQLSYRIKNVPFYSDMYSRSANGSFSNDRIKSELENYVADVAMLSLEPEEHRMERSLEINRRHNVFMQSLFCYLVVSRQWTKADAAFFEDLLLSPTVDSMDARVITAALTLSVMNLYDIRKLGTLASIYLKSDDEHIRQRALVGWAFALSGAVADDGKLRVMISKMLKVPGVLNELSDLQKQIIFCLNAEKDNDVIRKDIMPEIIKNNNLNITRFGITEKEEDPMADVFDPGAADRAAEKVEESFRKMIDMQKAGSDIYFGGFSQMKRFPFFYNIANWFYPFYLEHPGISDVVGKLKDTPLLSAVLKNGPFCDSDKYSFTLALSSVISRIPANMRDLLNSPDSLGQVVGMEEQAEPAYIRRMVLQDMYRFFRLHPQREQLINPFDDNHFVFVSHPCFKDTDIRKIIPELCSFCYKRKNIMAVGKLLMPYNVSEDSELCYFAVLVGLENKSSNWPADRLAEALIRLSPNDKRAMSLYAKVCFNNSDYGTSAEYYGRLYAEDDGNRMLALKYCAALSMSKQYDKAINLLYKLDIEEPESMPVRRVLAWTLMGLNRFGQAEREYERLMQSPKAGLSDMLNSGYCQWVQGNIGRAVALFRAYLSAKNKQVKDYDILVDFNNDLGFLGDFGINHVDAKIMADFVSAGDGAA